MLRVVDIVEGTSVDGPGLRTAIYFAGCDHHCPGCHNPHTWDFNAGRDMSINDLLEVIIRNDFNVTFSGGDPLYQLPQLIELSKKIKNIQKNIWCYTGFVFEEICQNSEVRELLAHIDVLVDGPFVESLKDETLIFKGSSNQRLINCRESMKYGNVILFEPDITLN